MLREEQAVIYMLAQINCASIAQANEVVHQIKRFLPPTKYVQKLSKICTLNIIKKIISEEKNL